MVVANAAGRPVTIEFGLEPVPNALYSFSLLNEVERVVGLNTWVVQTVEKLSVEQRQTNRIVFEGLRDALMPLSDEPNFPSYLYNLSELNPVQLRGRVLEPLRIEAARRLSHAPPLLKSLLEDVQVYLDCVKLVLGEERFDVQLYTEVHRLLLDPEALQQLVLTHLEFLWKSFYVAEWRRVQPGLLWQVKMLKHNMALIQDLSLATAFRTLAGRDLPAGVADLLAGSTRIVVVPSWHGGRHVAAWLPSNGEGPAQPVVARLFFSEPPNYDLGALTNTPVGRSELRARLDALADETRLHIIELLTQRDELSAQELIASLDLSQSNVSRHLKQLVSMGFLSERRGDGANKTYRLSSYYFARTIQALEQLLAGGEQSTIVDQASDDAIPQALRRFFDASGHLTTWPPSRQADKLLILTYLSSFFAADRVYSEKEVNALLAAHSVIDVAALRRALCEFHFFDRKPDGSEYWLTEKHA